jgi:hypothetical protein
MNALAGSSSQRSTTWKAVVLTTRVGSAPPMTDETEPGSVTSMSV